GRGKTLAIHGPTTMPEISHVRILSSLSCALALAACAPDAGKSDADKAAPTKTEAKAPEAKAPETKPDAKAPDAKPDAKPETPAASKFRKGQTAPSGLSPEDLLEFNKAQGDPMGEITLEQALAGDEALAD